MENSLEIAGRLKSQTDVRTGDPGEVQVDVLHFFRYDTRDMGSLAQLVPGLTDRCGIYVLQFDNGDEYVGQTTDIVARYANHRRTWNDIVAVLFATCQPEHLDGLEQTVIRKEQRTHSLRNRKFANVPGGHGDVEIVVNEGHTIPLPWDRERRVTIRETPPTTREARFWRLGEHPLYGSIRSLLQRYLRETVPSPVDSQGLWVLTALPTTDRGRRLFTLSVGNTETVYGWEQCDDPAVLGTVINVSDEDEALRRKLDACGLSITHEPAGYAIAAHHPVRRIVCEGITAASEVLAQDYVLDAAHRLNVVLMRQGSVLFRRYHNQLFAADVLTASWRASGGRASDPAVRKRRGP
jgi:hypothetical protein